MVKQGYKETEIGVIPEDWICAKIGEIANVLMCKRIFVEQTSGKGDIPFFKIGTFGKEADAYISHELYSEYKNKYSFPKKGDILLSAAGTLGRTVVYDGRDAYFQDSNIVWLDVDKSILCNEYLNHYYKVIKWASSEGSTISRLYNGIICDTALAVPPLPEQKRIAEALTNVDSMISSLEKLIAKKKAVKQGAMQELLSGKKRLPGFTGEWIKRKLCDCTERIIVGLATSVTQYYRNQGTVIFRNLNILPNKLNDSDILFLDSDFVNSYPNKRVKANDVLTVHTGYVGVSCIVPEKYDGALTFTTLITTTKNNILLPTYLMIHLNSELGTKMIEMLQAGGGRNNLNVSDFEQYEMEFPRDIEEQTAITLILSDMYREIETLEQKLAKICQVKQGMMQQLLTGKIRLMAEEKAIIAIPASEPTDLPHSKSGHNQQFDDAIMIAAIVNAFYSDKYPLGRKKVQKLLYLLRRKQEEDISAFKKKAAGPYADEVRYKGGEPIAKKQGYIVASSTQKGTVFSKGKEIDTALSYVDKWQMQPYIDWLTSTFKYTKTNDLELYATIDMAICDLQHESIAVSVDSVKDLIRSNKEWKDKLTKTYFSDADVARAIAMCKRLYS